MANKTNFKRTNSPTTRKYVRIVLQVADNEKNAEPLNKVYELLKKSAGPFYGEQGYPIAVLKLEYVELLDVLAGVVPGEKKGK